MTATFGPEFLVNTVTDDSQIDPAITALRGGRFLVTWTVVNFEVEDSENNIIKAQIFNADGSKAGTEFQVTPEGLGAQTQADVTALANGGFVITWTDGSAIGETPTGEAIRAQRFNAEGTKVGTNFVVNTTTARDQHEPSVTVLTNGQFVVTWRDESLSSGDTNGSAVRAQLFDSDGEKVGDEFLVNTVTTRDQSQPAVTALADGRFVVSYSDGSAVGADPSSAGVRAQIFNTDGSKSGSEFLVNSSTNGDQFASAITALPNGGFVVSWTDFGGNAGDSSSAAVRAQVFGATGAKLGQEILVNTTTDKAQATPAIAALPDGRFVISWNDQSVASFSDVFAQVFNANGSKSGEEFVIHTTTTGLQAESAITVLADGRFVVTWEDTSGLAGDEGAAILARIFDPRTGGINLAGSVLKDDFVGTGFSDSLTGDSGIDRINGGGGNDFIFGGQDQDRLLGGTGNDELKSDEGNDTVFGGAGNDILLGGDGNDQLRGDGGLDRLTGGAGNDLLFGGMGKDILNGGVGLDDFVFATSAEANGDQIIGFRTREDDINLRAFMPGGEFIGGNAFSGEDGQVRYVKATGLLQGDVNGDGKADWSLTILNKAALGAGDFIL